MGSSPACERTIDVPVLHSTNDPVPYVHFEEPGEKQAWPNMAACWSPAMPATGSDRPRNAAGSQCPTRPYDGTTSGSACGGTPKSWHSSADHCPASMSNSSVRDALDASVTWCRPPVSRAIRYESTVPTASEPPVTADHTSGSFSASQVSFVPVKYGSSRSPVSSVTRSSSPCSLIRVQMAAVRRSCQTMARRGDTSVARSQITAVSRWFVIPMQLGGGSAPSSACPHAASVACQMPSGRCSTHPGWG